MQTKMQITLNLNKFQIKMIAVPGGLKVNPV